MKRKVILAMMALGFCLSCSKSEETPLPVITNIQLNSDRLEMTLGEDAILSYVITPSELSSSKVLWSSSNNSVVSVDNTGKIVAISIGNAVISVKTDNALTDNCQVTVNRIIVNQIVLNKTTVDLLPDAETILTASVNPANATDKSIVWASNNESVATVDSQGKVIAKVRGIASITATNQASGKSATCTVNVKHIEDFITLNFGYAGASINNYVVNGRLLSQFINNSPDPVEIKSISTSSGCYDIKLYGEYGVYQPGSGLNAQLSYTNANRPNVTWFFTWRGTSRHVTHSIDIRNL